MKKYDLIVTGAGTLVGKEISKFFLSKKKKILATYRKTYPNDLKKKLNIKKIDFSKNFLIPKSKIFIHTAAAVTNQVKKKSEYKNTNVIGLKKILNQIKNNQNFKTFILISTMSVYGNIKVKRVNENTKPTFVDDYGKSKMQMEKILCTFSKKFNKNYIILRLPGVVGHNSSWNFLSLTMKKMKKNETIFYNNAEQYFNNIIHAEDLAKIISSMLQKKIYGIFNISSQKPLKLKKVMKILKIGLKSKSEIIEVNSGKSFCINSKKLQDKGIKLPTTENSLRKFINSNI